MHRQSGRARNTAVAIALMFFLMLHSTVAQSEDWSDADEAAATSSGLTDENEATSQDPDEMTAESRGLDGMIAESETMDGREAESRSPASMVTGGEMQPEREGTSTSLTDSKQARSDAGSRAIESPGQSNSETTTTPGVLVARKHLLRAQQRAENARTVYGNMMQRNYPRGEARIEIVNERDASMKALEAAKSALAAAGG